MRPDMAVQDGGGATNRMMYYTPAGSDTYFTNFHQGRNIHSGPPPPPHHTGVLPGVVTGANVISQGGGGGVGGGGGGPAQAPTPPGASPHDMSKQGGGPPTQPTHVGAHSQMPGASTFQMNYTISNSQRHSGPQTQYFRTPNQQRMATNPRSQVMNSNGLPTIGYPQIPSFPVPQMHFMQPQWVSHRQAPGYTFSTSAQTPMVFQSVYPYVPNQSQSHYMMPLRPTGAGASTGGGGGHGGTPPQQQSIQQQSPVPMQQQTVMGAGGSPAGGISLGGGGGPSGHPVGVYQTVPMSGMVNIGGNVGQPTVQNKSKPRLYALPIVDPVTGKNVINEMLKSEENSGASDSPARTEKEEKIAEFSSKINKAAASSSETDVSTPQPSETSGEGTMPQISGAMNGPSENLYSIPSENVGLSQLGMNVSSEPWKQTSEKERDPTVDSSICDTVNQKTVVDFVAAAKLETVLEEPEASTAVQNLALNQFEGQQTPVVSARGGGVRVPCPVAANVVPLVKQQPASIVSPLPVSQPVEVMPPPAMSAKPHPQAPAAKEVTREFPAKHPVPASKPIQTSTHKPTHAASSAGEANDANVTKKVMPTSQEGASERKKMAEVVPKEEGKKEEKAVEPVTPIPVEEPLPQRQPPQANGDEIIDGKPTQRQKSKKVHKNRELNRKGAEKEGTDMDAFSDAQQQQKQEAAAASAALTNVSNAATAPVSQRIETPMQPSMDEKVVNETSKSRTETPPPPATQVPPASKTSALPSSVTPKGATATSNENVPVQLNSNTSSKVESHPPKVPSSKPGNEKNLDNKLSATEMPPVVPEQNVVGNSKRDEVEKEVSVEKITEDSVKEVAKTKQLNENIVESTKVEKDISTAEKNDKEEEIVAVRNGENKLSSLPPKEKKMEEGDSSTKEEQDLEANSAPGVPAVIENESSETIISKLIAKNNYKEDQWSPINPQGKKKYERDFLLGLQNDPQSVKKPENLPDLDIVLKDHTNRAPSRQVDMKNIAHLSRNSQDFTPCFVKSMAPRSMTTKRGSQQGKPKGAAKIVYVTIPSNSDVKLHEAENAWKPRNKLPSKEAKVELKETEELYGAMRGILNKLTPQNFDKLVQQVIRLPIDTMEKLVGVINLVFDKAVDEPNFSVAYAELCNTLNAVNIAKQVKRGDDSGHENFRKILLKRCQVEFEKDKAAEYKLHERSKEIDKEPNEERRKELRLILEEDERRSRRKSVGVTRFIGELYKLGMINQPIMTTCIEALLDASDEESLECLCKLLTTVGKVMEEALEKKQPQRNSMVVYFGRMKSIVNERKTSSRVRFMLQDVIDLRNSKWVPRRNEANPKKINEINMEAERESMEQSQLTANYSQMSRGGGGGMNRRDDKSKAEEWNTVQSKNRPFNVDSHKLKVADTENVQLGSRNLHSVWGKGAGGMGMGSSGGDKRHNNIYTTLNEEPGGREGSNRGRIPMRHKDSSQSYTKSSSTSAVGISAAEERERAITAVRDNVRGAQTSMESPRLRAAPPSKTSSRDGSVSEERSMANSKSQKAPTHLSADDLDKLFKMTLEDYLSTNNEKETYDYLKIELPIVNYVDFIKFSVEKVLETSGAVRRSVSRLLGYLISHQLFNKQLFVKGLNKVLADSEELLLDVPMFWSYVAEILSVMLEEKVLPLSILSQFTADLPQHLQAPFVLAVLGLLHKEKGASWVKERWAESGLNWEDYIPTKNVDKLKDLGLDYIVDSGHGQSNPGSIAMENVEQKVADILQTSGSADAVFDWIEANVSKETKEEPSFIRALTTASLINAMDSKAKESLLSTAGKILQRYLNGNEKLELQCLYAIQALSHKLEHPKGQLRKVFEYLHGIDVIPKEAFTAWAASPEEPHGKPVALKSLTQFFTYLNEADDDDDEEA